MNGVMDAPREAEDYNCCSSSFSLTSNMIIGLGEGRSSTKPISSNLEVKLLALETIVGYINKLFLDSPGRPISGSQLGLKVRETCPDFSPVAYNCINLRDLLQKNIPNLIESGRCGSDYLYTLEKRSGDSSAEVRTESEPESHLEQKPASLKESDEVVWRTYASPNTEFKLFANRETGELRVHPKNNVKLNKVWVNIPPYSADQHFELAKEFVEGQITDVQAGMSLTRAPAWWIGFYNDLKPLGLSGPWMQFRRVKILESLASSLKSLDIPITHVPTIGARPRSSGSESKSQSEFVRLNKATNESSEAKLRRVALDVVRAMSIQQLRDLPVRLGDVLDALEA